MNFALSDEQVLLREAAGHALSRIDTVAAARAALDGEPLPDLWRTAREAGWTGLLVAEERGGAGLGAFDAMLVLEECGRRLTGTGLIGHLGATLVLERAAARLAAAERNGAAPTPDASPEAAKPVAAEPAVPSAATDALARLATGERRAALVYARPPFDDALPSLDADSRLTGTARFVLDLAGADDIVVPARGPDGELRAPPTRPEWERSASSAATPLARSAT